VRWHWTAGDLAIWDNRTTLHAGANDFGDAPRSGTRATVARGPQVSAVAEADRYRGPLADVSKLTAGYGLPKAGSASPTSPSAGTS
jgi:hypothetical protein